MVIRPHEGAAREGEWDGPAQKARVRSPEEPSYFARIFAFRDDGKDENTKSSYRFIHHFVSSDGDPGAPSIVACRTGIAVLNGARGGTVLRGEDRAGVYRHLASHLEQADIDPPPLVSEQEMGRHLRHVGGAMLEVREGGAASAAAPQSEPAHLSGYAAVYDSPSVSFGGWREIIARGAFDAALEGQRDIKALWNHDSNFVLGSVSAGTLALDSDERGLFVTIKPPSSALADSFVESIRRGDVRQMSIGFTVRAQEWVEDGSGEMLRVLRDIDLWEVSPVAFPAYPATTVSAGAQQRAGRLHVQSFRLRLMELERK